MNRLKHNTRGQFVIIAALLIAILTLSVALSIHQTNLHRQQLAYEPVQELILGVTSDLDRALTHALSLTTQKYQEDRSLGETYAEIEGDNFVSQWKRSIIASYSHLGINITMIGEQTDKGPKDVSWNINWLKNGTPGISQVITPQFYMDIDAYGYKGWVGQAGKFVKLTIIPESIKPDTTGTKLNFSIVQSKLSDNAPIPIPNLIPESLNETRIHITEDFWADYTNGLRITSLKYLGGGNYIVTFNQGINKHTRGVELTVNTPEDNIVVSALYHRDIKYSINLQSQEVNSPFPTNEGTIEFDGVNYTLNGNRINLTVNPGRYRARYFPEPDYEFVNWTTTENLQAAPFNTNSTWVTVDGDGNLTAFYKPIPKPRIISIILDSRELEGNSSNLGSITFDANTYTILPSPLVPIMTNKTYFVAYEPETSYYFWQWEWPPDQNNFTRLENSHAASTHLTIIESEDVTVVHLTAVYGKSPPPPPEEVNVILRSFEKTYLEPTCVAEQNLGQIKLGAITYELANTTTVNTNTEYELRYFPEKGYTFLNWTTTANIEVSDPYSSWTSVTISGYGTITAFYSGCKITLNSRQYDNSTFNLGLIILGKYQPPRLNWTFTGVPRDTYRLQYVPKNSSYQFRWWECTGDFSLENPTSATTNITIYDDASVTAVYSFVPRPPPPFVGEWETLYLAKNPSLLETPDAMLLTSNMLPNSYWTGKEGTLPIPPKPSWQYIYINSTPTTENIILAKYVNVTLYIQLATGKADNITTELSFTYNGEKYVIGNCTFYNLVGEGWYTYTTNTAVLNKESWPIPDAAIIPEGSKITLMLAIPPDSGTLHIIWSEEKQSRVELF